MLLYPPTREAAADAPLEIISKVGSKVEILREVVE